MSDERELAMRQDGLLVGIALMSLTCGMHFSPYFDPGFILVKAFIVPTFFITSPLLSFYFTSLLISLAAVMVAGVPAALYERYQGQQQSDVRSLTIWLFSGMILAAPAFYSLLTQGTASAPVP